MQHEPFKELKFYLDKNTVLAQVSRPVPFRLLTLYSQSRFREIATSPQVLLEVEIYNGDSQ